MKIELSDQFIELKSVIKKIEKAGFSAFFVGGAVRDLILKRQIHDIDIATSATPEQIKGIFKHIENYSGEKHGTVLILENRKPVEVTTFRIDGDYLDHRRPVTVKFTTDLVEDLSRRDFTINALALSSEGDLHDYFDGISDIYNQVIKTVGEAEQRFDEDALRILRALRFSSQLGFKIESKTLQAIFNKSALLADVSIERIQSEIEKLLTGKYFEKTIDKLLDSKISTYLPVGNQLTRVDFIKEINFQFKPENNIQAWWLFSNFYSSKIDKIILLKKDWKLDNKKISGLQILFKYGNRIQPKNTNIDTLMVFDIVVNQQFANFLFTLNSTTKSNIEYINYLEELERNLPIKSKSQLLITGTDLLDSQLVSPGPQMGLIISQLLNEVVTGQLTNKKDELLKRAKEILKND